jgi:hypothetical protein
MKPDLQIRATLALKPFDEQDTDALRTSGSIIRQAHAHLRDENGDLPVPRRLALLPEGREICDRVRVRN